MNEWQIMGNCFIDLLKELDSAFNKSDIKNYAEKNSKKWFYHSVQLNHK